MIICYFYNKKRNVFCNLYMVILLILELIFQKHLILKFLASKLVYQK
jgi:hypothetical protein